MGYTGYIVPSNTRGRVAVLYCTHDLTFWRIRKCCSPCLLSPPSALRAIPPPQPKLSQAHTVSALSLLFLVFATLMLSAVILSLLALSGRPRLPSCRKVHCKHTRCHVQGHACARTHARTHTQTPKSRASARRRDAQLDDTHNAPRTRALTSSRSARFIHARSCEM